MTHWVVDKKVVITFGKKQVLGMHTKNKMITNAVVLMNQDLDLLPKETDVSTGLWEVPLWHMLLNHSFAS